MLAIHNAWMQLCIHQIGVSEGIQRPRGQVQTSGWTGNARKLQHGRLSGVRCSLSENSGWKRLYAMCDSKRHGREICPRKKALHLLQNTCGDAQGRSDGDDRGSDRECQGNHMPQDGCRGQVPAAGLLRPDRAAVGSGERLRIGQDVGNAPHAARRISPAEGSAAPQEVIRPGRTTTRVSFILLPSSRFREEYRSRHYATRTDGL